MIDEPPKEKAERRAKETPSVFLLAMVDGLARRELGTKRLMQRQVKCPANS
jgi:hypothetical protein